MALGVRSWLFLPLLVISSTSGAAETNWSVNSATDVMTDVKNGSAALSDQFGNRLIFSCNGLTEPTLAVQFLPKKYLGSSGKVVTVRFEPDRPPPSILWEYVSKGAYTVDDKFIDWFSAQVGDGQRLIRVRALNYEDQPVDAQFLSMNGRTAINQVRAICGKEGV